MSPDLNPFENVWGIMSRKVYENGGQFYSVNALKTAIEHVWSSRVRLNQDRPWTSNNPRRKSHMRLVSGRMGMENVVYRMKCVVHEKGGHTRTRDLALGHAEIKGL
ncbi:hypothetical protein AVEN_210523-1 [Araneus ventricosus]|uniref:Tc1-like transposase DDE domain-containing protein n=1 Tax=Araneus ventricosus TaxID=182803 RepID=A0A4Y2FDP9_ARAVE|nr:hypothetical protein AVEN_210523-1 [Araneus ventricosus]